MDDSLTADDLHEIIRILIEHRNRLDDEMPVDRFKAQDESHDVGYQRKRQRVSDVERLIQKMRVERDGLKSLMS